MTSVDVIANLLQQCNLDEFTIDKDDNAVWVKVPFEEGNVVYVKIRPHGSDESDERFLTFKSYQPWKFDVWPELSNKITRALLVRNADLYQSRWEIEDEGDSSCFVVRQTISVNSSFTVERFFDSVIEVSAQMHHFVRQWIVELTAGTSRST